MPTDPGTAQPFASARAAVICSWAGLSRARGRPALRELHQRPTRPTLAVEHEMTQKVEAIYTGGVLKPTRELSPSGQAACAPDSGDDRRT